jgi:uncharacterized protein (DUF1499 family)
MCLLFLPLIIAITVFTTIAVTAAVFMAMWTMMLSLAALGVGSCYLYQLYKKHPINDVSAIYETDKPLGFLKEIYMGLSSCPLQTMKIQQRIYPDLKPLEYSTNEISVDEMYSRVLKLAKQRCCWQVIATNDKEHAIQCICKSPIMRFVDDVMIRVSQYSDKVIVQMRSKSRRGKRDFGANYNRIQQFFLDLMNVPYSQSSGSSSTSEY